jgi:DNA-binding MarR family transcriptional regulator
MSQRHSSPREIALWARLVRYVSTSTGAIDRDLARANVESLSTYDVLYAVYQAPERRVRFGDLHRGLILSKSALSRSVDALVRRGFLRKEDCPDDRRGHYVMLTAKGLEALRRSWKIYGPGIRREFAAKLNAADLDVLQGLLLKLEKTP